jgi:hypothetical protein
MNSKNISWLLAMALTTGVGCKKENSTGSSEGGTTDLSSANPTAEKNADPGCSIQNVDGGSKITCGQSEAFIPGAGNSAPKVPKLFDGDMQGYPPRPGAQVGDYLISVTKTSSNQELITIWIEKEKAIMQYENGMVIPRDKAIYFDSSDCSGDGVYQPNPDIHSYDFGMGNRIIYWDQYYKAGDVPTHCYPRSKKEKDGSCTTLTGPVSGDFNGYVAKPANPRVTVKLFGGYKIRVE